MATKLEWKISGSLLGKISIVQEHVSVGCYFSGSDPDITYTFFSKLKQELSLPAVGQGPNLAVGSV